MKSKNLIFNVRLKKDFEFYFPLNVHMLTPEKNKPLCNGLLSH